MKNNMGELKKSAKKRKRRFLYYSLCTTLSFIFIRIILIFYSIMKFDPQDYLISKVNYNSEQHNLIYLEVSHKTAFSPLHIQILEGSVNLYSNSELMAEIKIPLINFEKYGNLDFKGNLFLKKINPKVIYNHFKLQRTLHVNFTGSIWFRFCLINFKKSHTKEFTFKNKNSKSCISIKKIENESDSNFIRNSIEIDNLDFQIPNFINFNIEPVNIKFVGDLPFILKLPKLRIKKGKIVSNLRVSTFIKKNEFQFYSRAVCNYFEKKQILLICESMEFAKINKKYKINIKEEFIKKDATKDRINPNALFSNLISTSNSIKGNVELDQIPFITEKTIFRFKDCKKIYLLSTNEGNFAEFLISLKSSQGKFKAFFNFHLRDVESFLKLILNPKSITITDKNEGLFSDLSFKYNGILNLVYDRKEIKIYESDSKNKNDIGKVIEINHLISETKDSIFINSTMELKAPHYYNYASAKNLNFRFEFSSNSYAGKLTVAIDSLYIFYNGSIKGNFKSTLFLNPYSRALKFQTLDNIFLTPISVKQKNNEYYTIKPSEFLKKGKGKCNLLDMNDIILEYTDLKKIEPLRLGFKMFTKSFNDYKIFDQPSKEYNISRKDDLCKTEIRNIFTIPKFTSVYFDKNPNFMISEDSIVELRITNGIPKIHIEKIFIEFLLSIEDLRFLIREKIKFGMSKKPFSSLLGKLLNELNDTKSDPNYQINSNLQVTGNLNTVNEKMNMSLNLGLDSCILDTFKIGQLQLQDTSIRFCRLYTQTELGRVYFKKHIKDSYTWISLELDCALDILNYDIDYKITNSGVHDLSTGILEKDKISEIIHLMKNEDYKVKDLVNITIDTKDDYILGENINFTSDLIIEYTEIRNFIRYKLTNILSLLFKAVPTDLSLDIKSRNIDLLYFQIHPENRLNPSFKFADTKLKNINCKQNFKMHLKSDSLYKLHNRIDIENQRLRIRDEYSIILNMEILSTNFSKSNISIYKIEFKCPFIKTSSNSKNDKIIFEHPFDVFTYNLGLNLNIQFPPDIHLILEIGNRTFLDTELVSIYNTGGYFVLYLSKLDILNNFVKLLTEIYCKQNHLSLTLKKKDEIFKIEFSKAWSAIYDIQFVIEKIRNSTFYNRMTNIVAYTKTSSECKVKFDEYSEFLKNFML